MKYILVVLLSIILCSNAWCGVEFDNSNDYISIADYTLFDSNHLSFSAWVYFYSDNTDDYIYSCGDSGVSKGFLVLRDDTDGVTARTDCFTVVVVTDGQDYRTSSATNSAVSGEWIHIAFTFSGGTAADELNLYINGELDANSPDTTGELDYTAAGSSHYIGSLNGGAANNVCDGIISELAVWYSVTTASTLTAEQVKQLASSRTKGMPLQIVPPNISGYWPLDDHPHSDTANSANGLKFQNWSRKNTVGNADEGTASGCVSKAENYLSYI